MDYGAHVHDGEPRLRLVAAREFDVQVPKFKLYDAPKQLQEPHAPVDQLGPVFLQQVPVVTGNDFQSMMSAFNKRCNFDSNKRVSPSIVKEAKRLASRVSPKGLFEPFDWTQDVFDAWLVKFSPDKQERMRKALLNLHDVNFRSLNTKSLMVKGEVLLKRNDPSWAPRVIYVGSDEYNVLTGPLQDEFNNRLNHALNTFSDHSVERIVFAYKKDDVTIANAIANCKRYYEGDFSSNDRSQLRDVHEIFAHWMKCFGLPRWYIRFYVENSKTFRVRSYDYGIDAEINNQLATGGTDTTGRNSVWNVCLWYSFVRSQRISKTRIAVLGDDIVGGTDARGLDIPAWVSHCADAGMVLKASERRFTCDLTFLSRFFVQQGQDFCMVPLIGKALCRFNARANRNQEISDEQYMCGKALSYAYEFRHVQYLRDAFLDRALLTGIPFSDVKLVDLTWFSRQGVHSVAQVIHATKNDPVQLSEGEFLEVIMAKYDIGYWNMDMLRDRFILSSDKKIFEDADYYAFQHEIE